MPRNATKNVSKYLEFCSTTDRLSFLMHMNQLQEPVFNKRLEDQIIFKTSLQF